MAKDLFHNQVKEALTNDGWRVTHDPFTIRISQSIKVTVQPPELVEGAYSALTSSADGGT